MLSKVPSYAQQAWDFAQSGIQGYQQAQQFAQSLGLARPSGGQPPPAAPPDAGSATAPSPTTPSVPSGIPPTAALPPSVGDAGGVSPPQPSSQPTGGMDQLSALLQALLHRQIPALPPPVSQTPSPAMAAPQPQTDALGLLRVMLTSPQLQQALQSAPTVAGAAPAVHLPVPAPSAPSQLRSVQIPLGAVLNTLVALSGRAMEDLNESVSEEEPEVPDYLVADDGDLLVDPASADDRAALVAHLFLLSDAAQRSGWYPSPGGPEDEEADVEADESDAWARDAGFL